MYMNSKFIEFVENVVRFNQSFFETEYVSWSLWSRAGLLDASSQVSRYVMSKNTYIPWLFVFLREHTYSPHESFTLKRGVKAKQISRELVVLLVP